MKKTGIFLLLATASYGQLISQSLERQEISSAGTFSMAGNVSLSWTLGQPALVETFTASTIVLTQGFQQAEIGTTGIDQAGTGNLIVNVYPNPASYQFYFQFTSPVDGEMEYKVYDSRGRVVSGESAIAVSQGSQTQEISPDGWATGVYYLEVRFTSGGKESLFHSKLEYVQ